MHSKILPVAFIKKLHIEITTFHYLTDSRWYSTYKNLNV